ncbi:MAG: hypothetical protein OEW39_10800 [Deltaproteobacteria bacterium]|nr:hypothetical protein [Deltaproteobacteria bacterium]
MVLSQREKMLVGLLAVLLVMGVFYFSGRALRVQEQALKERITRQEEIIRQVTALQQKRTRLGVLPQSLPLTQPLIGYVETLSDRSSLKGRVQLNVVPGQISGDFQGVELKVDDLSLDELSFLIFTLESANPPLVIDQLELSPAFREKDLLRLTMRVLARK